MPRYLTQHPHVSPWCALQKATCEVVTIVAFLELLRRPIQYHFSEGPFIVVYADRPALRNNCNDFGST